MPLNAYHFLTRWTVRATIEEVSGVSHTRVCPPATAGKWRGKTPAGPGGGTACPPPAPPTPRGSRPRPPRGGRTTRDAPHERPRGRAARKRPADGRGTDVRPADG